MITYFIINKIGTVLYQSAYPKKKRKNNSDSLKQQQSEDNESQRIRYLPLLVIKDLVKANLNNSIQYIKLGTKTIAFKEQQNLLYIACTNDKKKNPETTIPISLLQLHLKIIHDFIKFHYGPHWFLHVQGNNYNNSNSYSRTVVNNKTATTAANMTTTITQADLEICLLQLIPFFQCGKLLSSSDTLCASEQVQIGEDLRFRLIENMILCCNSAFTFQQQPFHLNINNNLHNNLHRNPFFLPSPVATATSSISSSSNSRDSYLETNTVSNTTWAYCFLFAREKIVAKCKNPSLIDKDNLPDECIYFLKLLVSQFLLEKQESVSDTTTTLPQNISNSTMTATTNTTTSQESPSSSTTANSSHPSFLTYVYDANSATAPFKIKEKSASSVTVVSSDSSVSYWSNPLSNNIITHHHHHTTTRMPSNTLTSSNLNQKATIADILNGGDYSPPPPSTRNNSTAFLSSSVPSSSNNAISLMASSVSAAAKTTSSVGLLNNNGHISSAPSSPIRNRSRSHSLSNTSSTHQDHVDPLKNLLTSIMNGGVTAAAAVAAAAATAVDSCSYPDQIEDVKLVKRWVEIDDRIYLANVILILLSDGLCAVVMCKDDPSLSENKPPLLPPLFNHVKSPWKPPSTQVKQFKTQLRHCLSDFSSFLLTKESTHFTNLSFVATYPGLVHFTHFLKGVMTAPLLTDLNDLDKNHELLHEMYEKYNAAITDRSRWIWPNDIKIKKLCNEMLHIGLICRNDPTKTKTIQMSKNQEYYFVYQRNKTTELLAIYFSIVPSDRLASLHESLLRDIDQRVYQ